MKTDNTSNEAHGTTIIKFALSAFGFSVLLIQMLVIRNDTP